MLEGGADLEGVLDGVVGRLSRPGTPREAKALLVDARRLLAVVRNWRTIAPTDAARAQMIERVDLLLQDIDLALPPEPEPPSPARDARRAGPAQRTPIPAARRTPQPAAPAQRTPLPAAPAQRTPIPAAPAQRTPLPAAPVREEARPRLGSDPVFRRGEPAAIEPPPSLTLDIPAAQSPAQRAKEAPAPPPAAASPANGAAPRDPMRPRTLPDLDISGIAQLTDEPQGLPFDDATLDRRPPRASRADPDALRMRPSSTPPYGRRRAEVPDDAPDWGSRPSRPSQLIEDPETSDGVIYGGSNVLEDSGRPTPRPAARSSAPPAQRDRTAIAVRPFPAPEVLDKRLIMLNEPYSKRAEAFRTLRRKLAGTLDPKEPMFEAVGDYRNLRRKGPIGPRTIAVTSAQAGEGKTTCAANLALAFRESAHEKVLLLEANLRAPSLAALFGFEPPVCFAKQMAKNRDVSRASWTVAEQFDPLHVLAVDPASKTSPLLDPVAFTNALEQLVDAGYDHIIVDTPHALGGTDVNLVADAVDGVVIVAWIKKSKKASVKQAIEQLKPATILGVVTLEG